MEVYKEIKKDIMILLLVFSFIGLIINIFNIGADSTDKDGFHRSGFTLLTDYGTGKEYLYRDGVIIPRK